MDNDKEKNHIEELKEKLFFNKKSTWKDVGTNGEKEIMDFAEGYKAFLDAAKTEREAAIYIEKAAEEAGYVRIEDAGPEDDKLILVFDKVSCILADIGDRKSLEDGFLIVGAHIDAPRIDLKGNPLYESENMAYFKTHYYGGIKKYQWVTRPLAMHGVVIMTDGTEKTIVIGEKDEDPVFTINDLLPHLGKDQMNKQASDFIEGEQLNILTGSVPYEYNDDKDHVKLAIMKLLYDTYGITEGDFISAELQMVPAGKSRDVGLDCSFVGGYGQDDRICAYTTLQAFLSAEATGNNRLAVFFDKEEIGSKGNAGADSNLMERAISALMNHAGKGDYQNALSALSSSKVISADVNAGIDPEWASVNDKLNAGKVGYGVCLTKFTGARGKSGSNEAHAEFTAAVRGAFEKGDVLFQNAELGKVDQGGGGTIAMFLAFFGMDVIDCGPAVLSMHAPFEIASKGDLYHTYKAYKAFYQYL